ncbi:MAG: octaprenyl diphosphate synthase [Gammaproteobacteria bacterium]|nr:octaprenyl diphosphate synthase [Gammaproteobacteria bacterium]MCW8841077.1 octaprenyl diphosphate synthase [Gammaproteobacteria bacterium]MCW8927988.1 octaprenyl diphosphate synthase [Gammaproteobacteria bacterium]MCW8957868.1 octaprenyl diphosphate synthase [Gammaproteobacteria bacterium]MCW8973752.1 octaprenyl diphosphate synthase [Gammaproteobacteria bacterium]
MEIQDVYELIAADRQAVDGVIIKRLHSEVVLINQISHYIINSGGKRLRPVLLLLSARAFGYEGTDHHELAAVVEFIHTATLLHDDVVDGSEMRRGKETANNVWGNEASVLVGDFLYSRAFQMMVGVNNMQVMQILSEATNTIAEGEVKQLLNVHNADLGEAGYLDVIRSKTAKLFESSARLGAVLSGRSEQEQQALADYGMHLGIAFQLIDDALDYSSSSEDLGKNIGDDLAEGKPTLPLIHVINNGTPEQATLVREALEQGGLDHIDEIKSAIESVGAIAYTSRSAQAEADKAIDALAILEPSPYKEALIALAHFAVQRSH